MLTGQQAGSELTDPIDIPASVKVLADAYQGKLGVDLQCLEETIHEGWKNVEERLARSGPLTPTRFSLRVTSDGRWICSQTCFQYPAWRNPRMVCNHLQAADTKLGQTLGSVTERDRHGSTISTALVESTIDQVSRKCFVKRQLTQWTPKNSEFSGTINVRSQAWPRVPRSSSRASASHGPPWPSPAVPSLGLPTHPAEP